MARHALGGINHHVAVVQFLVGQCPVVFLRALQRVLSLIVYVAVLLPGEEGVHLVADAHTVRVAADFEVLLQLVAHKVEHGIVGILVFEIRIVVAEQPQR